MVSKSNEEKSYSESNNERETDGWMMQKFQGDEVVRNQKRTECGMMEG